MSKTHSSAIQRLHSIRFCLFAVLLLTLAVVRIDWRGPVQPSDSHHVLAYASSMSVSELNRLTNAYRAQNNLGPLNLINALNTSAQAKAQHMIDNNYWAHVAPDGTQPWSFFQQAGYSYTSAGENLAYGFNDSDGVVGGWINSAGHRANMLGNYADVGYGFVNGSTYQGGQYTVVVAHYGVRSGSVFTPLTPSPTPTPAPPAPTPLAIPPAAPSTPPPAAPVAPVPTPSTPAPAETPAAPAEVTSTTPPASETPVAADSPDATTAPVATAAMKGVSVLEILRNGNFQLASMATLLAVVLACMGFVVTHLALIRHTVLAGEHYVMTHPTFDFVAVGAILVLILTTTVARIG